MRVRLADSRLILAALGLGGLMMAAGCCPLFPPGGNQNDNQNSANTNTNGNANVNGNANANTNANANNNANGNENENTNGNGNGNANTTDNFSVTSIAIQKDGMVAAGDRIVAYGSTVGGTVGVSYINVPDNTPIPITGNFRGDAVYCAGKKVILVADGTTKSVSVFDTTTGVLENIPDTNVFDIAPGAALENNNIAVEGNLVAILHRDLALPHKVLKIINVSTTPATVRTFTRMLSSAIAVDVEAATNRAVVLEKNNAALPDGVGNQFAVFEIGGDLDQIPNSINIETMSSVLASSTPKFKLGSNTILFRENNVATIRLLSISTGLLSTLALNPGATDPTFNFANDTGRIAYFLQRTGLDDVDLTANQQGNRVAVGMATDLAQLAAAVGNDLGNGARGGFGRSVAVAPTAQIYVAGRFATGVNAPSFLQVSPGNAGGFALLGDSENPTVSAADVTASANVLAFKVASGTGAVLGWFLP